MSRFLSLFLFAVCLVIAGTLAGAMPSEWPAALAIALAGTAIALALRAMGQRQPDGLDRQIADLRAQNAALTARVDKSFSMIDELADVVEQVATMAVEDKGPSVQNRLSALEVGILGAGTVSASSKAADQAPADPLTPIFDPQPGEPVAYILGTGQEATRGALSDLIARLITVASALDAAGKDVRLFLRLSPAALATSDVLNSILAAIESPAVQRRLTLLTAQSGFDYEAKTTLTTIAEQGCPYALEGVGEWSPSLAPMARAGLAFVFVDGPAVLSSAERGEDDPASLSRILAEHDIRIVAGGVGDPSQLDAVRTLKPAFVMGAGLGASEAPL